MESIGVNLQNAETAYQDKGIFNGLFPEIISDDTIINKYTEIIKLNKTCNYRQFNTQYTYIKKADKYLDCNKSM